MPSLHNSFTVFRRYYVEPTIFGGHNKMRVFQEEIFGPVMCATSFKDAAEAVSIANDTIFGLGAGVWTRDAHELFQVILTNHNTLADDSVIFLSLIADDGLGSEADPSGQSVGELLSCEQ